ncbi:MAG: hypothetical protein IJT64_03925 [Kiritimatiellae bacterium]|nr:hypothetical protein [Kiritimatiellia bacterium]
MRHRLATVLALVAIALALSVAEGAFFMRVKTTMRKALESGTMIEKSDAVVNGRDARISVFAFDKSRDETIAGIGKELALELDGGFMASRTEDGVRSDLIVLPGGDAGSSVAWLIESPVGDAAMPDDNILPGSDMMSHISIKKTGCVFSLHDVVGTPEVAMREAEAQLVALGWKLLLSGDRTAYFGKPGKQSVAVAAAFRSGNATRIAIIR